MGTPNRYYSSVAGLMTLTAPVSSLDTVMTVDSTAGVPSSVPFTILIDKGTDAEEIATVSSLSGNTMTVVRGEDGSVGVAHAAGVPIIHAGTARDLREPQEHIAATQGVHGLGSSSSVVGTTDSQTLTNKTISGAANTLTNIPLSALPADTATTDTTQTLTNKTLTAPHMTATVVTGGESVAGGLTADTLSTSGNATVGGNAAVTGTLGVTGATTLGALTASGLTDTGSATVAGTLGVTGTATVGNLSTSGSATVSGAVAVTGNTTSGTFKATGMGPAVVYQVAGQDATYATTSQWVNHVTGTIPALTITVPPSGRVRVTATANMSNTNTSTSNISFSYTIATSDSVFTLPASPSATVQSVYQDAAGICYTSAGAGRTLTGQTSFGPTTTSAGGRFSVVSILAGLAPGVTLTLQPQYRISTGTNLTAATALASIVAEPML